MSKWTINFEHDIDGIPKGVRKGRSPHDGYIRGAGLQFGNIKELCTNDPDFRRAYELAKDRTIVDGYKLINIYMLFRFYLPQINPGAIAEFGCYKGGSCIFMASLAKRFLKGAKVFGFDTFQGMPQTDRAVDLHKAGDFSDVNLPELRQYAAQAGLDNLTFVQGAFEETLPKVAGDLGPLALIHIDADIHSAVVYCYNEAKKFLVPGGYVVLDDPFTASCLGAFEAVEDQIIRGDNLSAEQVFPHLVFRYPPLQPEHPSK
jgi:SAM-dependent methyltransferase